MNATLKAFLISLVTTSFVLTSSASFAKQTEIGIGAIATDTSIIGKGEFVINDTIDEGDSLITGAKGSTTILFNDESMLTLGPNAHVSVEVYQEAKNEQPGRSVIRVHKGQFRYFPGGILESGGSQFVAVGDKLLGKSAVPKEASRSTQVKTASDNTNTNPASENKDRNSEPQGRPQIIASSEGTDEGTDSGGNTGVINGPPTENNRRNSGAANAATNQSATAGGDPETAGTGETGGGISGIVNASTEGASMAPPESSDSSDTGFGTALGESDAATVAAAEPDTNSDSGDSSSADSSETSSDTTENSDTSVATTDTTTDSGSSNSSLRDDVPLVVAIGGSGGAVGTGGNGGTDQNCVDNCGSSGNGGIPFPGSNGIGGNPGQTGGLGGGSFGPNIGTPGLSGPTGLDPSTPSISPSSPITGGVDSFIKTGIAGNVEAGVGNFIGAVDVFAAGSGKEISLLGSIKEGQNLGLQLDAPADLAQANINQAPSGNTTFSKDLSVSIGDRTPILATGQINNVGKELTGIASVGSVGKNLSNIGNVGNAGRDLGNLGSIGNVGRDLGNIGNVGRDLGNIGNVGRDLGNIGNVGRDLGNIGNVGNVGNARRN